MGCIFSFRNIKQYFGWSEFKFKELAKIVTILVTYICRAINIKIATDYKDEALSQDKCKLYAQEFTSSSTLTNPSGQVFNYLDWVETLVRMSRFDDPSHNLSYGINPSRRIEVKSQFGKNYESAQRLGASDQQSVPLLSYFRTK